MEENPLRDGDEWLGLLMKKNEMLGAHGLSYGMCFEQGLNRSNNLCGCHADQMCTTLANLSLCAVGGLFCKGLLLKEQRLYIMTYCKFYRAMIGRSEQILNKMIEI